MPSEVNPSKPLPVALKIAAVFICLYFFIVGVSGMGDAFKMFGKDFANNVLAATQNPLTALMMGLLATAIVQSSSTSTSIVVGMVAGGALTVNAAVPMIMGANLGTTITAMLVALGSIQRQAEFERAFGAALLHMFFNVFAICIMFPLEMGTHMLTHIAEFGQSAFTGVGGMHLANPLKASTGPVIELLEVVLFHNPILMLIVTIGITYVTLIGLVKSLRSLAMAKVEVFFDKVLFRDWRLAMIFGFGLTLILQTSSVPTSLAIPLAGAGVLRLMQVYPFTLGCNVGTTITAFLAALATGQALPVVVAFTHIAFNVLGIVFIWTVPVIRNLPLRAAQAVAKRSASRRAVPLLLIGGVYFVLPLLVVLILH